MAKRATELCPFCGDLFVTGVERGDHIVAEHAAECSEVLADYDQARLRERMDG